MKTILCRAQAFLVHGQGTIIWQKPSFYSKVIVLLVLAKDISVLSTQLKVKAKKKKKKKKKQKNNQNLSRPLDKGVNSISKHSETKIQPAASSCDIICFFWFLLIVITHLLSFIKSH